MRSGIVSITRSSWRSTTARRASSSHGPRRPHASSTGDGQPALGVPTKITIGFGVFIAILAALVPLSEIIKLVNIGTLFAFQLVNIGVIVLRRTEPDMVRPFRVPLVPFVPLIGIAFTLY
jgi:hypothetical protein